MAMRWIEDFEKDAAFDDTANVSTPPEDLQPAESAIQRPSVDSLRAQWEKQMRVEEPIKCPMQGAPQYQVGMQ